MKKFILPALCLSLLSSTAFAEDEEAKDIPTQVAEVVKTHDADSNGKLSKTELKAAKADLVKIFDADKDGKLSKDEKKAQKTALKDIIEGKEKKKKKKK